jgi:hypothetical protein
LEVKSGVIVDVGTQQDLDFSLGIPKAEENVGVSTPPEILPLTSSELSNTAGGKTVRDTPLNSGVAPVQTQRSFARNGWSARPIYKPTSKILEQSTTKSRCPACGKRSHNENESTRTV